VRTLGSFKPLEAHICPLGVRLCSLGVKCSPPSMRTSLLAGVRTPTEAFTPPASASLIVPPLVHAPLFIRSRLSFIHMRPYFICVRPYFIRVRPYFIRVRPYFICARPTLRSYVPLWQPFVPSIELCALQPVQYNGNLHPTIQRGSHRGQRNSDFTLSEVNMALTLI
jgi:hypothetical protein